jgi:hypothetical protein
MRVFEALALILLVTGAQVAAEGLHVDPVTGFTAQLPEGFVLRSGGPLYGRDGDDLILNIFPRDLMGRGLPGLRADMQPMVNGDLLVDAQDETGFTLVWRTGTGLVQYHAALGPDCGGPGVAAGVALASFPHREAEARAIFEALVPTITFQDCPTS